MPAMPPAEASLRLYAPAEGSSDRTADRPVTAPALCCRHSRYGYRAPNVAHQGLVPVIVEARRSKIHLDLSHASARDQHVLGGTHGERP